MLRNKSKSKKSFRNSPYYFDDCPICRAMSKEEKSGCSLSLKELRQAFAKAKGKKTVNFKKK